MKKTLRIIYDQFYSFLVQVFLSARINIGRGAQFFGWPYIRCAGIGSTLRIGNRFRACSIVSRNAIGVIQCVVIRTCAPNAHIDIGDDVGVSGCTISSQNSIKIGNHVLIGSGALITDSDQHALDWAARRRGDKGDSAPVVIEDDVFVGAHAIVLKGITIGRGAIVGAGAVVTHNVPPWTVIAGNPARVIKELPRGKV